MVKPGPLRLPPFLCLLAVILLSCGSVATRHRFYEPITEDIQNRNFEAAVEKLKAARQKNFYEKKDRLIFFLDAGLAYHYAGDNNSSIRLLTEAEEAADDLFTRSISRAAASLILNDNILEYSGEDYEILYTNLIKALDFMALDQFDDAFVEIRRSNLKLELLEQKYADAARRFKDIPRDDTLNVNKHLSYEIEKVRFNNDAFGRYLSMHMYAAEGKYDDARIDYDKLMDAFDSQPHIYSFPKPDVRYQASDGVILSFVAMAGLAPVKEAVGLRIRTDKDLNLVQVLYTDGPRKDSEYGHLPFPVTEDYYFKFSLPVLMSRPSQIGRIIVYADDEYLGELDLIEDVEAVAEETFKAKKSLIYFRTIARAIFKGLATHKVKQKIDKDHKDNRVAAWILKAAVDVGTDVIENADLRCSRLLPGRIYVGDFEIEPGVYNLKIEFISREGYVVSTYNIVDYEVKNKSWNLIEAFSLN